MSKIACYDAFSDINAILRTGGAGCINGQIMLGHELHELPSDIISIFESSVI